MHLADGHQLAEGRSATKVVAMEMRGDEKIDFLQLGLIGGDLMNAAGITCARVACVDKN